MTDSAPRCPLSNLPCQPSCAWCRKTTNADGAVTFRCAVLVGAKALHRIASDLHRQKTAYTAVLAAVAKVSEPQPAAAPKRVILNEDTMRPDTTPPSVIYHTPAGKPIDVSVDWERKRNLPQLVSFGGDWKPEEIVDAYRAMTEAPSDACESAENVDDATCSVDETPQNVNAEYKSVDKPARTIVCDVCGKPFTKTTKGRDPKTCREPECIKALRKRHQAKSLARTAAKKADAI